jgi:hypothetical protein
MNNCRILHVYIENIGVNKIPGYKITIAVRANVRGNWRCFQRIVEVISEESLKGIVQYGNKVCETEACKIFPSLSPKKFLF